MHFWVLWRFPRRTVRSCIFFKVLAAVVAVFAVIENSYACIKRIRTHRSGGLRPRDMRGVWCRPEDGHHRYEYKCSRPGRQGICIAAATPAAAPRSSESEILGVAALPRSPGSAGTADLFPRLQPEQAPTPMLLQRRHWVAPVLRSI